MTELEEKREESDSSPNPPASQQPGFFYRREGRLLAAWVLGAWAAGILIFGFFYMRLAHKIEARLSAGPFSDSVNIYTGSRTIAVGDESTRDELILRLRRNGFNTSRNNPLGWYNVRPRAVEILPGRDAAANMEAGVVEFSDGKVSRIISLQDNSERREFLLPPQLIANVSANREKRRLVTFNDIPANLVHAVVAVEDKHFFHHTGFDVFRMFKAAYVDVKDGRKSQGASTLSMQLARGLWLVPEKRWTRKAEELLITMHLEHKLTKQQIFEDYANQVYLGRRGPFSINGFGEGARAFFGKDLSQLTDPEAALLAGLIQRPSYFNPYRYPERARDRRNLVLNLMHDNGYLTDAKWRAALNTPVALSPEQSESLEDQYFVDLVNEDLQNRLGDRDKQLRYIYTTLDPDLQRAAEEAVHAGMPQIDQLLKRKKTPSTPGQPQVALVALDPRTGEIKALVGGRDYATSQLNHALAMRQPGSVFKPFVYAAALETAVQGSTQIFTPASMLDDSPTTFEFGRQIYQPGNFGHDFMGEVTLRTALAHSLNVATVSLAQQVGYGKVVSLARRMGLNDDVKATPSVALGSYVSTPVEIAGAYTAFANHGIHVTPTAVSLVRGADGNILYQHQADSSRVLDPRVTYLMVSLMQEVLRSGTGASVRGRGFTLPAAGKTGTSRDGWFAGFTSELLTVVWVGFDDNRDLDLEGARSALPIWTDFMKRAAKQRAYRDAKAFTAPAGIVTEEICADSGQLAGALCPNRHEEVFIEGTEPVVECELHSPLPMRQSADRMIELPASTVPPVPAKPVPAGQTGH